MCMNTATFIIKFSNLVLTKQSFLDKHIDVCTAQCVETAAYLSSSVSVHRFLSTNVVNWIHLVIIRGKERGEGEREREREGGSVCVCVREREREGEKSNV